MAQRETVKIKGTDSEWYHEAIFVMKEGVTRGYDKQTLAQEADKIIGNHIKRNGFPARENKDIDKALNYILCSVICILVFCMMLLIQ